MSKFGCCWELKTNRNGGIKVSYGSHGYNTIVAVIESSWQTEPLVRDKCHHVCQMTGELLVGNIVIYNGNPYIVHNSL